MFHVMLSIWARFSSNGLTDSIYQLERSVNQGVTQAGPNNEAEASPLLLSSEDTDVVFVRSLDQELYKIVTFYQTKEPEIFAEMRDVMHEESSFLDDTQARDMRQQLLDRARQARRSNAKELREEDEDDELAVDSDEEANETTAMRVDKVPLQDKRKRGPSVASQGLHRASLGSREPAHKMSLLASGEDGDTAAVDLMFARGVTLKKRMINIYVALCELKSFAQLNKTGFSKVCKKYDKTLDRHVRASYLSTQIAQSFPFRPETVQHVDDRIQTMEQAYADVITDGDLYTAKRELRLHLREHVVWERNTVWREMIGIERKAQAANLGVRRTLLGGEAPPEHVHLLGDQTGDFGLKEVQTPVGRYRCPSWLFSSTFILLVVIFAIFVVLLLLPIMEKPEQQNCLAMLVLVSLLWASEVCDCPFLMLLLLPCWSRIS